MTQTPRRGTHLDDKEYLEEEEDFVSILEEERQCKLFPEEQLLVVGKHQSW